MRGCTMILKNPYIKNKKQDNIKGHQLSSFLQDAILVSGVHRQCL